MVPAASVACLPENRTCGNTLAAESTDVHVRKTSLFAFAEIDTLKSLEEPLAKKLPCWLMEFDDVLIWKKCPAGPPKLMLLACQTVLPNCTPRFSNRASRVSSWRVVPGCGAEGGIGRFWPVLTSPLNTQLVAPGFSNSVHEYSRTIAGLPGMNASKMSLLL